MRTAEAIAVLESLQPGSSDLSCELGQRGDIAFLRMWKVSEPERWAVVYSPRDRWFSFEVVGGFSLDHVDEDLPDEEVRGLLSEYVGLAVLYLREGATPFRTAKLGFPGLKMSTGQGEVVLRRSLLRDLKGLVGLGHRS
jgi:hypothetical protein